ncbi:unnamed protein product [Clonostachys chloroleuca]|uniref:AHC1-like C2H2 zinc-finger domain-containing protein n=1 Tax=Clonostachys chloroleuca TaxID=1926264 RepID=A0AA35QDS4_9HYPO|nr:unnamed protein product [Clonostachys chloroleuca]
MFRFWSSDSSLPKPLEPLQQVQDINNPLLATTEITTDAAAQSPKRRRQSCDDGASPDLTVPAKKARLEDVGPSGLVPSSERCAPRSLGNPADVQSLRDKIEHILGTEILVKHNEKRLIDLELAKCQAALEQLRRCHLIPFPVSQATPEQMIATSNGTGPAIKPNAGGPVPRWAPPFGVTDGPYARHYAQWLMPDPAFDGLEPKGFFSVDGGRIILPVTEGRTTRQTIADFVGPNRGRSSRGLPGHKIQSLPSGRPEPKKKSGPCILKRADGQTVKLVCLDCQREDFSSTQGFINHCRIAHKRDFKSHEEAAVKSGQAFEASEPSPSSITPTEDKSPATPVVKPTTSVHPFARADMTEQQAYIALRSRIADSMELIRQGKLPGLAPMAMARAKPSTTGTGRQGGDEADVVPKTPYLSQLLKAKAFGGKLRDIVDDAKTKEVLSDVLPDEEDSELEEPSDSLPTRPPVVKRVPAKSTKSPVAAAARPASHKHHEIPFAAQRQHHRIVPATSDEDAEMEEPSLSPNTIISNNAPSLVSDDGEYDDSDEGSSVSGQSDGLDTESVSDIAEITIDDEHDPRGLRRTSTGVPSTVRLRQEDPKHVTFVSPMTDTRKENRRQKA